MAKDGFDFISCCGGWVNDAERNDAVWETKMMYRIDENGDWHYTQESLREQDLEWERIRRDAAGNDEPFCMEDSWDMQVVEFVFDEEQREKYRREKNSERS